MPYIAPAGIREAALICRTAATRHHLDLVYVIFLLLELAILFRLVVDDSKISMRSSVPSDRKLI